MRDYTRALMLFVSMAFWSPLMMQSVAGAPETKASVVSKQSLPYVDKQPVAVSKSTEPTVNTNALINEVRRAKIINPAFELHLVIKDDFARVNTAREAADKEDDCKIDAVIIAKIIMTNEPAVKSVAVLFHPDTATTIAATDDQSWKVLVTDAEIKQFKSGNMNQKALLSLLEVKHIARKEARLLSSGHLDRRERKEGVWQIPSRVYEKVDLRAQKVRD